MKSALIAFAIVVASGSHAEAGRLRNFIARLIPHRHHANAQITPVADPISTPRFRVECNGNSCRRVPAK